MIAIKKRMAWMLPRFRNGAVAPAQSPEAKEVHTSLKAVENAEPATHETYVDAIPNHQNAIDLVKGWSCAFPETLGLTAGPAHVYADPRVAWGLEQIGDTTGMNMLELGPLEGSHTHMLCHAPFGSPASVLSIEASRTAFVKCLVAKNILGMNQATFMLGDFNKFLDETDHSYDFILASGVLYHMADPLGLLQRLSKRTTRIFLWTHYYDKDLIATTSSGHLPFSGRIAIKTLEGEDFIQHERGYLDAAATDQFSGGIKPVHYWLERDGILRALEILGFDKIKTYMETPNHIHGPAFCVYAEKSPEMTS